MTRTRPLRVLLSPIVLAIVLVAAVLATAPSPAHAASPPKPADDPFYRYDGPTPLGDLAPGTVLKTRTSAAHIEGIPLPVRMVQVLYRTTDAVGRPIATATSVLRPAVTVGKPKLVSYQSFYDALTPDCQPSYSLAGGFDRGLIASAETALLATLLAQGYTVVDSDFEGQDGEFAAGPLYGKATLDGIRAASTSPGTGLSTSTPVGMIGYSGGAIASEWAAELAPSYAPDVAGRLVGTAVGGVLVDPIHNLHYVDGSTLWSGVMPMALSGLSRAYGIALEPYLSDRGTQVADQVKDACIADALGHYPGLRFDQLTKPQYATPESIPVLVSTANKLIMGTGGTPSSPLMIRQGAGGVTEGTPGDKPGIGAGDGVMIAGDVRSLAREYCDRGVTVDYRQYDPLSHVAAAVPFFGEATPWLFARFNGKAAPSSCGHIAPGNPIDPLPEG